MRTGHDYGIVVNDCLDWSRPLRGTKRTLFEGGVRGVGLIHGAGLSKAQPPTISQGLVHASDWMPSVIAFLRALPGLYTHFP
jgi:arylsulfatase A-like enzyme